MTDIQQMDDHIQLTLEVLIFECAAIYAFTTSSLKFNQTKKMES